MKLYSDHPGDFKCPYCNKGLCIDVPYDGQLELDGCIEKAQCPFCKKTIRVKVEVVLKTEVAK